jgi:3-deoxy-D-manno-octulosonic-acid transferase
VKLILANARLSPRSGRRYAKFSWFVAPIFALLDRVLVQFPEAVDRWQSIGARAEAVILTGSVKYDEPAAKPGRAAEFRNLAQALWGQELPRMILGASTFAGEEIMLGKLLLQLRDEFPNIKAIVVPRHVERSPEVKTELESLGLKIALRTGEPIENADVLLVNSTGELRDWQQLPDVVVIGKSFHSHGGQNPVEAIAAGTPVITGPQMENFSSVMKLLLDAGGLQQVSGEDELRSAVEAVLRDQPTARAAAVKGQIALQPHRGAAKRTAEIISTLQ